MSGTKVLKAGLVQFEVRPGDLQANLEHARRGLLQLAEAGVELAVLPEMWATGFAYPLLPELAKESPAILRELQDLASRYRLVIIGSLPELLDDNLYNTAVVLGSDGRQLGSYRKIHLFSPQQEDRFFEPGQTIQVWDTGLARLGLIICYDLRFPELARALALQGATILVVLAQWPASRIAHWQILLRARALENQLFVLGCNSCGQDGGLRCGGCSAIVSPWGEVLAEAGAAETELLARLDFTEMERFRHTMPCFTDRRPALYRGLGPRGSARDKVVARSLLREVTDSLKRAGKKVVFTNGCFDLLHLGHVRYLEAARRQGDSLVVAVNSDESVRQIKGPHRPIVPEDQRAEVVASLGCVSWVTIFNEPDPLALIRLLAPDVLVKGADWPEAEIVGAAEVRAAGGRVCQIPLEPGLSTSDLIEAIRRG